MTQLYLMKDDYDLADSAPGQYMPLRTDKQLPKAYFPDRLPPSLDLSDDVDSELPGEANPIRPAQGRFRPGTDGQLRVVRPVREPVAAAD